MNWKKWWKGIIGGAQEARVAKFRGSPTSRPVTPEPDYVCKNCGMLIESCHGHTVDECESYDNDPTKPDLRLRRILKERRVPRYGPPIILPNYQSSKGSVIKE